MNRFVRRGRIYHDEVLVVYRTSLDIVVYTCGLSTWESDGLVGV